MKIAAIGTGYVGLVTGACLAEMGNHVVCLDVVVEKIRVLNAGSMPLHEPGLLPIVARNVEAGRLQFTTDADMAIAHGSVLFIAVGTPPDEDGSADLKYVLAAARSVGRLMTDYKIVVDKSTVPVGTADRVRTAIAQELAARGVALEFAVVSNPEFLKEGAAIEDFMKPDRIIVGTDDERAASVMRALYAPFTRNHDRLLVMDVRSAEFTKYAANAMLATRISFMNELALLAERVGADIELVRKGIGSDPRIGYDFLYPGAGYGGSCFPKDVKAMISMARAEGLPLRVLGAVEQANERQKRLLVDKVVARFGEKLAGRRFAAHTARGRRLHPHVKQLGLIGRQASFDIAQRLAPGDLREGHDAKQVLATLRTHARVAAVALHGCAQKSSAVRTPSRARKASCPRSCVTRAWSDLGVSQIGESKFKSWAPMSRLKPASILALRLHGAQLIGPYRAESLAKNLSGDGGAEPAAGPRRYDASAFAACRIVDPATSATHIAMLRGFLAVGR